MFSINSFCFIFCGFVSLTHSANVSTSTVLVRLRWRDEWTGFLVPSTMWWALRLTVKLKGPKHFIRRETTCTYVASVHAPTVEVPITLSADQLQNLVSQLWVADGNRASDSQLDLNFQNHVNSGDRFDASPQKLFRYVDPQLFTRPTTAALIELFQAYEADSTVSDLITPEKRKKIDKFFDEIMKTTVMQNFRNTLKRYGYKPASTEIDFRKAMDTLWFGEYSRAKGVKGSSSFEHVFVGEIKNDEVSGLHNWIRLAWLENRDEIDYTGFIIKRKYISMIQFTWGDVWKPSGSMFFGTSPEFDFAVFTLCYLSNPGQNACNFLLKDCTGIQVTSYEEIQNGNRYIGSVFPAPGKTVANCKV